LIDYCLSWLLVSHQPYRDFPQNKKAPHTDAEKTTNENSDSNGKETKVAIVQAKVVRPEEKSLEEKPRAESASTDVSMATSVNSDDFDHDTKLPPIANEVNGKAENIAFSRDGLIAVAPVAATASPSTAKEAADVAAKSEGDVSGVAAQPTRHNDGDVWETVEVRVRTNRKKPADRSHHGASRHSHHSSANGSHDSFGRNKKTKNPHVPKPRNKSATRKIVREILFSVIDAVDEESHKKKVSGSVPSPTRKVSNSWKNGPPGSARQPAVSAPPPPPKKNFASVVAGGNMKQEGSMRDVAVRKLAESPLPKKDVAVNSAANQEKRPPRLSEAPRTARGAQTKLPTESLAKKSPGKRPKKTAGGTADQNTATTYQETVSAVSASSNARADSRENLEEVLDRKSDGSPGDTDQAFQNRDGTVSDKTGGDLTPNPPLPTLLSPERGNSATSSVASSLDAPHAAHPHRHSATAVDVNDVGYHLLDVCDKLSRDMSLFMSRRALALSSRRRERGALLSSLQDCVSSIWPGKGHVEPYGSCATQLDLPASDLDVVVRGLDRSLDGASSSHSIPSISRSKSGSNDSLGPSMSFEEGDEAQQHRIAASYGMMPTHLNGERVVRLAADIEKLPWAVQVNAIPTASVPVIKILCDPSRLTGGSHGGDWMAHHQHLPAQAAAAAGKNHSQQAATASQTDQEHGAYPQPTLLPWRGSDVMKGLLMLDITFEGPEHGGIGSTEFSARAVAEACAETGLHPDATPFVQVLMVLKELLSQRKLNEPYSGGLSSYALLLLVVALMRERAVIREEIERVERQRKAMVAAELDALNTIPPQKSQSNSSVSSANASKQSAADSNAGTRNGQPATRKDELSGRHSAAAAKDTRSQTKKNTKKSHTKQKAHANPQTGASKEVKKDPPPPSSSSSLSSWAAIAKKSSAPKSATKPDEKKQQESGEAQNRPQQPVKKPSFADAVARSVQTQSKGVSGENGMPPAKNQGKSAAIDPAHKTQEKKASDFPRKAKLEDNKSSIVQTASSGNTTAKKTGTAGSGNTTPKKTETSSTLHIAPPFYPQGYNDIVEVLCSGETTAGKLLMHFLLYYGQHFDAQSTAIDISGKHERDFMGQASPYSYFSPYIQRRAPGSIDPVTGMLVVDPIVIFDPLEGAEHKNVARRCFAWNSVRWIFAQSYATLASAVERSATPPATPGGPASTAPATEGRDRDLAMYDADAMGDLMDPSSPLLRCLLSF